MTPEEGKLISETIIDLRRHITETQVRLKALEASIVLTVPAEKRAEWYEQLDRLIRYFRQQALEAIEEASPSLAARLDDRTLDDLRDIEDPPGA